jgi:8-oxo-dGTP pyrophosphatase MutT (NUDIX family)
VPTAWRELERALALRAPRDVEERVSSRAAVALAFREAGTGLELLFIERAEHPGDPWSGQMAFPGGRWEEGDRDLAATAVRETREELGLDLLVDCERLGRLDEVRAMSRMRPLDLAITPFVFRVRRLPPLELSDEVRGVHWLPLDALLGPGLRSSLDYPHAGTTLRFPCFRANGKVIWGLTHRMFSNLQALLEGGAAPAGASAPAIAVARPPEA